MDANNIAIRVANLSKRYEIYAAPRDRLKQFLLPPLQRLAGKQTKDYFSEFWALRNVSFEVRKGETVGIIGRNGSGKSTLLQMICGTLTPTDGTIETTGRIAALLELGSGFNPEFTGRENVYMNAAVLGLNQQEIDSRFADIVAFADIGDFIEQPVKTYSSGMTVRLAFAVQAVIDPDILVVDEALAVGDEKFQRKCFARLEALKSSGAAILFVSHSSSNIIELCDRTLLLDQGRRLLFGGAPQTITAYQKLMYAPTDDAKNLINEYLAIDKLGALPSSQPSTRASTDSNTSQVEGFDSTLISETTVRYPSINAEIKSITIQNRSGRSVNILQSGSVYQFIVTGYYFAELHHICFGISIKSVSGTIITGQRYPAEAEFIEHIKRGQRFTVVYHFRIDVLPGMYFVGGGIWSDHQAVLNHRIEDAIIFRVSERTKTSSFGLVDSVAGDASFHVTDDQTFEEDG